MKRTILLLLSLFVAGATFSQNRELDTVRVGRELFYKPKNAFKLEVLKILNGDIIFAYERPIGYSSSIEFEIGPTVSYIGFNRMQFLGMVKNFPRYDMNFAKQHGNGAGGFLFSFAYKKYVLENQPALNGLFIAPRLKFRNYNSYIDFSGFNSSDYVNKLPDKLMNVKNHLYQGLLTFDFGMNHTFKNHFGLEYYFSFGLTANSFKYRYFNEFYNGEEDQYYYQLGRMKRTFFNTNFSFGLKFYIVN